MSTHSSNGNNGKQSQAGPADFPFPKTLWAALRRDPQAVMALFWAVDRLVRRKPTPSLCFPGSGACPFCHPDDYNRIPAAEN